MAFTLAAVELDRVAKRRDLFLYRAVLSLLGALVAVVAGYAMMWSQGLATGSSAYTGGDWLGAVFARVAALLQAAAVLFIAPLLSAGLIVRERRDRTLGLLVLADFNAPDIYLAKFLSAFLGTATLVLSTLPLLALASFLGGMDLNRALLLAGLWTGCAAFACATGLLFSAILPGYRSALVASAVAVILSMCVAWTGPGFVSPLLPSSMARFVATFPVVANRPGLFAALLVGATLLMAVATIRMLPRLAVEGARSDRRRRRAERRWRRRRRSSPARLAGRILRSAGMERVSVLPTILALALAVAVATPFLLPVAPCLLVLAIAVADLIHTLYGLSRSRAVPELLVTALDDEELADALWHGVGPRAWIYGALLTLTLAPFWWPALRADLGALPGHGWTWAFGAVSIGAYLLPLTFFGLFHAAFLRTYCCALSQRSDRPTAQTLYALATIVAGHAGGVGVLLCFIWLVTGAQVGAFQSVVSIYRYGGGTLLLFLAVLGGAAVYAILIRHYWTEFSHGLRYWLLENAQQRR